MHVPSDRFDRSRGRAGTGPVRGSHGSRHLPVAPGPDAGAVLARRGHRHRRPSGCLEAGRAVGPAGDHRQPCGGLGQHRARGDHEGRARRLHAVRRQCHYQRDQRDHLRAGTRQVASFARPGGHHQPDRDPPCRRGTSRVAGGGREAAGRVRAQEPGQAELCIGRHRQLSAPRHGAVRPGDRHAGHPHPLQGRCRADGAFADGQRDADRLPQPGFHHRAPARRSIEGTGHHRTAAAA